MLQHVVGESWSKYNFGIFIKIHVYDHCSLVNKHDKMSLLKTR